MTGGGDRVVDIMDRVLGRRSQYRPRAASDLKRLWRDQLRPSRRNLAWAGLMTLVVSFIPSAFALTWRFLLNDVLKTKPTNLSQSLLAIASALVLLVLWEAGKAIARATGGEGEVSAAATPAGGGQSGGNASAAAAPDPPSSAGAAA